MERIRSRDAERTIVMVGLSGGGWTTVLAAAIEPRIDGSVSVAGSWPEHLLTKSMRYPGDYEQVTPELYRIANRLELYTMAGYGEGRRHLQVFNERDTCCFAGSEGKAYETVVQDRLKALGAGAFEVSIDHDASGHIIGDLALKAVLRSAAELSQTIIATQDHATAKDIETRWAHRNVARFNIVRNDPLLGSEIRNEDDQLAAMIARAQPFCNSEDPEQRKLGGTRVREAIERFCKLLLVKDRVGKGDTLASITDYDGKNFGNFSNDVKALLIQDASHPGKLQAAHNYVTPGTHDDTPPPKAQLKVALGDLRRLKADYLG